MLPLMFLPHAEIFFKIIVYMTVQGITQGNWLYVIYRSTSDIYNHYQTFLPKMLTYELFFQHELNIYYT